jgi:hypothetical protein
MRYTSERKNTAWSFNVHRDAANFVGEGYMEQLSLKLKRQEPKTTHPGPLLSIHFDFSGKPGKSRKRGRFQYRWGRIVHPVDKTN